ncbi:MAG: phosphatase [Sulfurovum sp.]|nr:phosphatase [Sulfurovum sp.]
MIAIDLGSNTLRVLEYDCVRKCSTAQFEKIVKTADKLALTGVIDHTAIERVICAIKEAQEQIDFDGQEIVAVTTEAVRQAKNSNSTLLHIAEETGVKFCVISGNEEARLTLLAAQERLKKLQYNTASFALIDIGGGSTEIIFSCAKGYMSRSFPVGIVTIAQQYGDFDKICQALPDKMLDMQIFCNETFATRGEIDTFVATAGTPTTVAAMKLGQTYATYDATQINGVSLKKEELDFYLEKLLSMSFEEREETVGTGRSDLIVAGILIFKQLYTILKSDICIVIDDGLREGVALDTCMKQASITM